MSDDKSQRGAPDSRRIDVHEANQLKEAVALVCTSAEKVRESLRNDAPGWRTPTWPSLSPM